MKLITDYLEKTGAACPDKTAFVDADGSVTYSRFISNARNVGTAVAAIGRRSPVAVYMNKSVACVTAMFGVAYSGNFYIVIDPMMPAERILSIFDTVRPVAVLTERSMADKAAALSFNGAVVMYEDAVNVPQDREMLESIRRSAVETDLLYCLFTSGSTGVPKGTAISHRNVIAYSQWVTDTFGITEDTVFGNQTPFYFSMSVTDIYSTVRSGATMVIIPKKFFAFPVKLVDFMNTNAVNTIYWVPSALSIVANMDLLKYVELRGLQKVLFAGEVMPTKQLNYWMNHFPDALFANLYGPTETTDICTYYTVNRHFEDGASLPIGNACDNCDVMVVGDDGRECAPGEEGELFVRGPFVALGYYNNPEKTAAAFVQNPLNSAYPETVYRTGDIVRYNELGELIYAGRKDFQIKHMGYRIELGEIEAAVSAAEGVGAEACVYDAANDAIILVYEGKADRDSVLSAARKRLPEYMIPSVIIKTKSMPHNSNGKIDRVWLRNNYKQMMGEN